MLAVLTGLGRASPLSQAPDDVRPAGTLSHHTQAQATSSAPSLHDDVI